MRGPLGVLTGVRKYVLISFRITKLISTLFGYYLRSGGDICMICNEDNIQKCEWGLSTDMGSSWRLGQKNLFLMDRKNRLVANRSTYWLTYSSSPTH